MVARTAIRITTITATPITCHQTETLLKIDTRWLEKTLISPWIDQDQQRTWRR